MPSAKPRSMPLTKRHTGPPVGIGPTTYASRAVRKPPGRALNWCILWLTRPNTPHVPGRIRGASKHRRCFRDSAGKLTVPSVSMPTDSVHAADEGRLLMGLFARAASLATVPVQSGAPVRFRRHRDGVRSRQGADVRHRDSVRSCACVRTPRQENAGASTPGRVEVCQRSSDRSRISSWTSPPRSRSTAKRTW